MKLITNLRKTDVFLAGVLRILRRPILWVVVIVFGFYSNHELIIKSVTEDSLPTMLLYLSLYYSLVLLIGLLFIIFNQSIIFMMTLKRRGVFGEHEFIIDENGLVEQTDVNVTLHKWDDIRRIIKTKLYLYIVLSNLSAHVIPMRTFSTRKQFDEFISYFERYKK